MDNMTMNTQALIDIEPRLLIKAISLIGTLRSLILRYQLIDDWDEEMRSIVDADINDALEPLIWKIHQHLHRVI